MSLLVDGHCHVFPKGMPASKTAWTRLDYGFTAEEYVATLDRFGIKYGVIAAASIFDDGNAYTLETLERYDRLRATVQAGPEFSRAQLRQYAEAGVVGVRFQWRNLDSLPDLSSPEMRRFIHNLRDEGLHIELLARGRDLPALLPPLIETGVGIVVDHLGDPDPEEGVHGPGCNALIAAAAAGLAWVKVSALIRISEDLAKPLIARLISEAGTERLIWGSDAPFVGHEDHTDYEDALARFARVLPDEQARQRVSRTAYDLYFS